MIVFVKFCLCCIIYLNWHVCSSLELKAVDCRCDIYLPEGEILRFSYYGSFEYLAMGAEMFYMNTDLPKDNIYEVCQAIALQSECTPVEHEPAALPTILEKAVLASKQGYSNMYQHKVKLGVIVEPRNHVGLRSVIENVCDKLQIPVILFHGTQNKELAQTIRQESTCSITLVAMDITNLDSYAYNELLLSDEQFWSKLNTEVDDSIVVFQTDSGICGSDADIVKFEKFSYCGGLLHALNVLNNGSLVGNGGFSIRHVDTMRRLLRTNPDHRPHFYWEDVLFSHWCLKDPQCTVCPQDVAIQFAASGSSHDSLQAWGFHRNWHKATNLQDKEQPFVPVCEFNRLIHELNTKKDPTGEL
jgi:hypothetical protein